MFRTLLWFNFVVSLASAQISVTGVASAGGFDPGITAPNGISSVFCTGLTGIPPLSEAAAFPLPKSLAGVQVLVNGVSAPLIAVADAGSYQQINFQTVSMAPPGTNGTEVTVVQTMNGIPRSGSIKVGISGSVFFVYPSGHAIIQRPADSSLIAPDNAARPGDVLVAYATGLGDTEPPVPPGEATPVDPLSAIPGAGVVIGGVSAQVLFAGLTPGLAGVYQLNFVVPANVPAGDVELVFQRDTPFYRYQSLPAKIHVTN